MLVMGGSLHLLFEGAVVCKWQSSLLLLGAVLLVDARGKKGGVRARAVMLRRGKNMLWW